MTLVCVWVWEWVFLREHVPLCAAVCYRSCVYVCMWLSQMISQVYPLSPSLAAPSLQPTISSKHLQPHSPPSAPGPTRCLFCFSVKRACPSHQSTALFIFMYRREARKGPSYGGLYWLSIKRTLSDDRLVIYETVIKAGELSYVRTRSRMKAAHTAALILDTCLSLSGHGDTANAPNGAETPKDLWAVNLCSP